jgi:sarcosine oxidase subunit beta
MTENPIGIVGGGITGASVAYHLARRSERDVVVFERDAIASRTTAKSAAYVGFRGGHTPVQRALMRYGIELYNDLIAESTTNAFYRRLGGLDLATTAAGRKTLRSSYRAARSDDDADDRFVRYFEGERVGESLLLPPVELETVRGALFWPNYGYVNPSELAFEFADRAENAGAEFRVNSRVDDIVCSDGDPVVHVGGEPVVLDHLVLAAGPWNAELADTVGLDLPLRFSLAPGLVLEDPSESSYPSLNHHESGVYLRQHHNDRVFVGHYQGDYAEAPKQAPDVPDEVPGRIVDEVIETLRTLVPYLYDSGIEEQWVGLRGLTPDSNPIVGWTDVEGMSVVAYNATGIQHAPAAGRILARQLLDGDPTEYYEDVSISRFDGHTDVRTGVDG